LLSNVWLAVALPALGWLVNGLIGRSLSRRASGILACAMVGGAFIITLLVLADYLSHGYAASDPQQVVTLFPWIYSGGLHLDFAFLVDPLSLTMMLLITGVGFLIHVYSTAYMAHDDGYPRFFCYLNLFIAMMLVLVLGANLPLMFVGWEGVGLCSFLLIGFWYTSMANANAGMKAFVVNRIGDVGVLVGMFMLFAYFGSLNFSDILSRAGEVFGSSEAWIPTAIALALFLGACGKSAQIPLHIWLPDAMAGPTPVSALIHAATMVTAGVYMVTRLNPVFTASPTAGFVVAVIGCATAFMAGTIALTQNDIKKVLAYSTVSQLGFMFLAAGVGAYWVAMFHVLTHAFFKACLFLGSGSVIHAMHEEQDTRVMGGLGKYMKVTYFTFMVSTLAIVGIFPFAGFFSKDEILWQVATWQGRLPWAPGVLYTVALLTAFMTAFYMGRVTFKTFAGKPRWTEHYVQHHHHPHESSPAMTIPLIVLSLLATVGGAALFVPAWLFGGHRFLEEWLAHSAGVNAVPHGAPFASLGGEGSTEVIFAALSVVGAAIMLFVAWNLYTQRYGATEGFKKSAAPLYRFSLNKWYFDEAYHKLVVVPGVALAYAFWRILDVRIVDGIVNGLAWLIGLVGLIIRPLQTGFVRNYALYLLIGAVIFLLVVRL